MAEWISGIADLPSAAACQILRRRGSGNDLGDQVAARLWDLPHTALVPVHTEVPELYGVRRTPGMMGRLAARTVGHLHLAVCARGPHPATRDPKVEDRLRRFPAEISLQRERGRSLRRLRAAFLAVSWRVDSHEFPPRGRTDAGLAREHLEEQTAIRGVDIEEFG